MKVKPRNLCKLFFSTIVIALFCFTAACPDPDPCDGKCIKCKQTCLNAKCIDTGMAPCGDGRCIGKTESCSCNPTCNPCTQTCDKGKCKAKESTYGTWTECFDTGECRLLMAGESCPPTGCQPPCNPSCQVCKPIMVGVQIKGYQCEDRAGAQDCGDSGHCVMSNLPGSDTQKLCPNDDACKGLNCEPCTQQCEKVGDAPAKCVDNSNKWCTNSGRCAGVNDSCTPTEDPDHTV